MLVHNFRSLKLQCLQNGLDYTVVLLRDELQIFLRLQVYFEETFSTSKWYAVRPRYENCFSMSVKHPMMVDDLKQLQVFDDRCLSSSTRIGMEQRKINKQIGEIS